MALSMLLDSSLPLPAALMGIVNSSVGLPPRRTSSVAVICVAMLERITAVSVKNHVGCWDMSLRAKFSLHSWPAAAALPHRLKKADHEGPFHSGWRSQPITLIQR